MILPACIIFVYHQPSHQAASAKSLFRKWARTHLLSDKHFVSTGSFLDPTEGEQEDMRCTESIHAFVALTDPAVVALSITQSDRSVHVCSHLMGKVHLRSLCCTIWASAYGDEHSGIRRLQAAQGQHAQPEQPGPSGSAAPSARWAARQAAQGQHAQPEQPGPSRVRGAPGPSSDAAWMHPSRSRPPPLRDRAPLQPASPAAPDAEAAGAQAAAPTQRQRIAAVLRTDTTDMMTLAQTQPGSEDWAHTGTAVHSAALFFF